MCSSATTLHAQKVHAAGAMQNLHRHLQDVATVLLDTLPPHHLYAIGPAEGLRGEILVWNGDVFVAGVTEHARQPFVMKRPQGVKAIFLAYSQVPVWDTVEVTALIENIQQLEGLIEHTAQQKGIDIQTPFPFLLFGKIKNGKGHIMYKDPAVPLQQKEEVEQAKYYYDLPPQKVQMLGFYSNRDYGTFTHHGSNIHVHYRLYSKHHAGHLDEVILDPKEPLRILLPSRNINSANQSF
jgi:acetolactate decarboxylase